jgi:hypothetical protein
MKIFFPDLKCTASVGPLNPKGNRNVFVKYVASMFIGRSTPTVKEVLPAVAIRLKYIFPNTEVCVIEGSKRAIQLKPFADFSKIKKSQWKAYTKQRIKKR